MDASEVTVSGPLFTDKTYDATIQILNKSGDSEIDISQEIEEEAEETHLLLCSIGRGHIHYHPG